VARSCKDVVFLNTVKLKHKVEGIRKNCQLCFLAMCEKSALEIFKLVSIVDVVRWFFASALSYPSPSQLALVFPHCREVDHTKTPYLQVVLLLFHEVIDWLFLQCG